jgi:hypothetical protein
MTAVNASSHTSAVTWVSSHSPGCRLQAACKLRKFVLALGQALCTPCQLLNLLRQRLHSTLRVEHRHEVLVIASKERQEDLHTDLSLEVMLEPTAALLTIVPLGPEFGGRNTWKSQGDLRCLPHK